MNSRNSLLGETEIFWINNNLENSYHARQAKTLKGKQNHLYGKLANILALNCRWKKKSQLTEGVKLNISRAH